jgi:hypothetical protein
MKIKKLFIALFFGLSAFSGFSESQQKLHINADTGGKTWEISANGAHFLMRQILPEQLQGFYLSRGFSLKEIEPYTASCVFMTVLRNDSAPGGLHFKRDNLKVTLAGKPHSLIPVEEWVQRLRDINSKTSAVIAFRWAQFPIDQVFEPGGDWNQGMVSVGLPPGSQFDATVNWDIDGKPFEIKLESVECAK